MICVYALGKLKGIVCKFYRFGNLVNFREKGREGKREINIFNNKGDIR